MVKILSIHDTEEWNSYIKKLPFNQQDVYFTPEYYSLYQNYGDGETMCFVYEDSDGVVLYPFLRNSVNSLGYDLHEEYYDIQGAYGYNGPVSSSMDSAFISRFWSAFNDYCKQNNIIAEFMRFHPMIRNYEISKDHFKMIFDRNTVYIDLYQPIEIISENIRPEARKHIRKAANKMEIRRMDNSDENVETFNAIYKENMDRVGSVPYLYFNLNHFKSLFKLDNVEFFFAYIDNKPVACYSGLVSHDYYATYLSASLTEYNRTGCNNLLYWTMINSAKEQGCHYIHFGGGTDGNPDNSLLKYKMNYSPTLSEFWIGKKVHNEEVYQQVVEQWKSKYPMSYEKNKVKLLGYREI